MGFWSGLGKGLLAGGAAIAAPFTGGASLATVLPAILAGGGAVASGISGGRAAGRVAEAGVNQQQDRIGLDAARLNLEAPQRRAANAVRGDLLANWQPSSFTGSGRNLQLQGGASNAQFSESTRQLGQGMSREALLSQMEGGDTFTPTQLPQSGKLDSILNIIGGIGTGIGAIDAMRPPKAPPPPVKPPQIPNMALINRQNPWDKVTF